MEVDMVDYAIITLLDKNNVNLGDYELPLKITIEELTQKMISFFKAKDGERYMYLSDLQFSYNGRVLMKQETLYENEVWDGSLLKIIF